VMYRYLYRGRYRFYTSDEVLHWSKYSPSKTYGYPPILSIYEKAMTALGMDRWLYDYFYERIIPPGVVVTVTDDPDGLDARIKEQELKMREDPHHVAWVAVSKRTGQGKTEFVKFGSNFAEMDFQPINDRVGDAIAAQFGVSRIFMGNPGQLGGRDTSTNQLVVMSRVVESGQRIYNQKTIPRLLKAFGITDWKLELSVPDVKTEATLLEEESRRVSNAAQMNAMGFSVELAPNGKFIYSGAAVTPMEQQQQAAQAQMSMMGGMGGAPGGAPGGMGGAPGGAPGQGGMPGGGGAAGGPIAPDSAGGAAPPPLNTQKGRREKLPKPEDEDEGEDDIDLEKMPKFQGGIEVHPTKPWLHRHRVKPDARGSHIGYEQKYHNIEEVHTDKTAHGGSAPVGITDEAPQEKYDDPWWKAAGVQRIEQGDDEHFQKDNVAATLFPFGGGYSVRVTDDKSHFQKNFPKEYDARNYLQALYEQGTYDPKVTAPSLVDRAKADRPHSFKGEFDLSPALGNPVRNMLDQLPPDHLKFLDGINEQEQPSDVVYAYGRISLKRGIAPEKAKNIISAYVGVEAVGDLLNQHWQQAVVGRDKFPTAVAGHGLREFKGEAYRLYVNDPMLLKRVNKGVYETIKDKVFRGKEFGEE